MLRDMVSLLIGGLGPVEIGLFLILVAILGGYWVYRQSSQRSDPVEWYWIIGIAVLFLFGIIPGLVGIYLYLNTKRRYDTGDETTSTTTRPSSNWSIGVLILLGTLFSGSVVGTVFDELNFNGILGFAIGAVAVFLAFSYLFYGR